LSFKAEVSLIVTDELVGSCRT